MFNRDQFNNADLRQVSNASMAAIDALQAFDPEVQMAAIGAVSILLAAHVDMPLGDVLGSVDRMMSDAEGKRPEFAAVEMYMKEEL
ncbi:MAG: hypothetical protein KKE29_20090 [Proteobacteria bacterium]|nr:hypothetical protein [Pseudomonadota bacterium]MBU4576024.1 hypothetical protein [Pseudomonadota bacterium]MBV1715990.1 hypothetical protein [Desulfarculus sp.]